MTTMVQFWKDPGARIIRILNIGVKLKIKYVWWLEKNNAIKIRNALAFHGFMGLWSDLNGSPVQLSLSNSPTIPVGFKFTKWQKPATSPHTDDRTCPRKSAKRNTDNKAKFVDSFNYQVCVESLQWKWSLTISFCLPMQEKISQKMSNKRSACQKMWTRSAECD